MFAEYHTFNILLDISIIYYNYNYNYQLHWVSIIKAANQANFKQPQNDDTICELFCIIILLKLALIA